MPSQYVDTGYWRTAASNARAMAETFDDRSARLAMLEIAIKLEAIARRAHALETDVQLVGGEEKKAS